MAKSELAAAEQQQAAAKQAVDIARANTRSAQARVSRSQSQLLGAKALEQQVPITEAAYKSAVASVERAKVALEQAQLNLAYTKIVAPISGQVTQKSVDLGQYVSAAQLLFTIVPLNQVYVTANFKETQLANVAPGQKARHARRHIQRRIRRRGGFNCGRHRFKTSAAAAAKCHRKLYQSCATHPVKILVKQPVTLGWFCVRG